MIQNLTLPEYYINSVEIDVTPTVGETVIGTVGSEFDIEKPTFTAEPDGFQCTASLTLELYVDGKAPWQVDEPTKFGDVDVEFLIHIPESRAEIEGYLGDWADGDPYTEMDEEFRHHIESGILQYIIDPVGDMLSNSYNGIIPRMHFTRPHTQDGEETDT